MIVGNWFHNNPADHKKHVHKVLCHLHENGLYACPDKCHFLKTPSNTSASSSLKTDWRWIPPRFRLFKIGLSPARLKTFNHFLALLIFTAASFLIIPTLWFHLPGWPVRISHGTLPMLPGNQYFLMPLPFLQEWPNSTGIHRNPQE